MNRLLSRGGIVYKNAKKCKKVQKSWKKKTTLAVAQSPTGEKKYFNYLEYLK